MPLNTYHKKRNFLKTPEPKGRLKKSLFKKLFVVQKHAASHLHYDFRLELNGVLLSWAIPKGPSLDPSVKRLAIQTEDHPISYGSFEGVIPKGQYGGGTVMLWDAGEWDCEDDDPNQALEKGHLNFTLHAKKLKGKWHLIRFKKKEKTWFLIKGKDRYATSAFDITLEKPKSIFSKKTIDQITENN